jgi:sortase A
MMLRDCRSALRFSGAQRARTLLALLLALVGLVLIGDGLWIRAKAVLAQVLLERAFAASLATGRPVKAWSWADTWPVARIAVARLGASAIVLEGGSGEALAFGPAHLSGTPQPGEPGTMVVAAHRDTHFAFLGAVRVGDAVAVTRADGTTFTYRVTGSAVVPFDRPGIEPQALGHHLVLATCWPLDGRLSGPLRYVVYADLDAAQVE